MWPLRGDNPTLGAIARGVLATRNVVFALEFAGRLSSLPWVGSSGRRLGGLTCAAAALLALPAAVAAAPGDRDPSFSQDGIVEVGWGINDMAVQSDGRIVVAGVDGAATGWKVARFMPDGTPDPSFGDDGEVTTEFPGQAEAVAFALALTPDGGIVVGGRTVDETGDCYPGLRCQYLALARYDADGSLDDGFSADGMDTSDPSTFSMIRDVAVAADGGIVLAGTRSDPSADEEFVVGRRHSDGSPDEDFGGDGLVALSFDGYDSPIANAVLVEPNGSVVAAGSASSWDGRFSTTELILVRVLDDGSLDEGFGEGGLQTLDSGTEDAAQALIRQADGKLIVAGYASSAMVARFTATGHLDPTFGAGGLALATVGSSGDDVSLDQSGRVLLAGRDQDQSQVHTQGDVLTARFTANGAPDASFGNAGAISTDFLGRDDWGHAVAVQSDGKVISAGNGLIVRHLDGDGPADLDADGLPDDVDACPEAHSTNRDGCPGPYARVITDAVFEAGTGDHRWFSATLGSRSHGACGRTDEAQLVRRTAGSDEVVSRMDTSYDPRVKYPLARRGTYHVVVPEWTGPRVGTCAAAESEPIVLERHQRVVELDYSAKSDKLVAQVTAPPGAGRCMRRERVVLSYVEGPPYEPIRAAAGVTDGVGRIRFDRPRPIIDPSTGAEPATYFATVRRSPRCAVAKSFGASPRP